MVPSRICLDDWDRVMSPPAVTVLNSAPVEASPPELASDTRPVAAVATISVALTRTASPAMALPMSAAAVSVTFVPWIVAFWPGLRIEPAVASSVTSPLKVPMDEEAMAMSPAASFTTMSPLFVAKPEPSTPPADPRVSRFTSLLMAPGRFAAMWMPPAPWARPEAVPAETTRPLATTSMSLDASDCPTLLPAFRAM